jgi:hypothetical protein
VSYPPVFPSLLAVLLLVLEPIPALVVGSLLVRFVAVLAVYLVMKDSGRLVAVLTAVLTALTAFQLEAFAWGAYPQILGMSLGLLASYYTIRFCAHRAWRDAIAAVLLVVGTISTHTLIAGALVPALAISCLYGIWISPRVRENWRGSILFVALLMLVSGLSLASGVVGGEGRAVMNPAGLTLEQGLRLALGESPLPWIVVLGIGIACLLHARWPGDEFLSVSVGLGWFVVGAGLFAVTGERRSLLLAQVGVLLLAATELSRWWRGFASDREPRRRGRRRLRVPLLIFTAALVGAIAVPGVAQYRRATDFYRIIDVEEVKALEFLRDTVDEGEVVMASEGRNSMPIGWWVEGIANTPTISGHDPRFLTFPAEIVEAERAEAFFGGDLEAEEAIDLLDSVDAKYLVVDRRGPASGWMFRADRPTFDVIYDSSTLVILKVR